MDASLIETLRSPEIYFTQPFWQDKKVPIFIYGTGTFAQTVYSVLFQKDIAVSGFMDHRPREIPFINAIPVFQPDDAAIPSETRKNAVIILGIHNREVYMPAIIENLQKLNYARFVTVIDLYDYFSQELGARYWLTKRDFYQKFEDEINIAHNLLADETSRSVYSATLHFRITGDFAFLPEPDLEHQYFPVDLPAWKSPLRLIDCGAYDGDAIRDFMKAGYEINALAAIEPDMANFAKLSSFAKHNLVDLQELILFPCGAYSQTTQFHFSSGQGEASGITTKGDTTIQCIALDDALPNFAPTLIKMDIEGAELDALQGTLKTIATYRPSLAISIYHTPTHLWEIPLFINSFAKHNDLNYTYHLRAHAHNCFDTVFYIIPA